MPDYLRIHYPNHPSVRGTLPRGTRVQLHAATDAWMRGDRYGEIVGYGRAREYHDRDSGRTERARPYLVKLDKSGRTIRLHPTHVFEVRRIERKTLAEGFDDLVRPL